MLKLHQKEKRWRKKSKKQDPNIKICLCQKGVALSFVVKGNPSMTKKEICYTAFPYVATYREALFILPMKKGVPPSWVPSAPCLAMLALQVSVCALGRDMITRFLMILQHTAATKLEKIAMLAKKAPTSHCLQRSQNQGQPWIKFFFIQSCCT